MFVLRLRVRGFVLEEPYMRLPLPRIPTDLRSIGLRVGVNKGFKVFFRVFFELLFPPKVQAVDERPHGSGESSPLTHLRLQGGKTKQKARPQPSQAEPRKYGADDSQRHHIEKATSTREKHL